MSTINTQIDLEYLDSMSGGDTEMRNTLLHMLAEELPKEKDVLAEAAERGDLPAIFQASHSLKSTLAYTGNTEAIRLNEGIEASSRHGLWTAEDQEQLKVLFERMDFLLVALRDLTSE
ncbi:MAG: Hpt domain-containing protein [Saprospiraceae bacterium]|nr:Hpt domain-containing protein [Saprospiraceae bacterium]